MNILRVALTVKLTIKKQFYVNKVNVLLDFWPILKGVKPIKPTFLSFNYHFSTIFNHFINL